MDDRLGVHSTNSFLEKILIEQIDIVEVYIFQNRSVPEKGPRHLVPLREQVLREPEPDKTRHTGDQDSHAYSLAADLAERPRRCRQYSKRSWTVCDKGILGSQPVSA